MKNNIALLLSLLFVFSVGFAKDQDTLRSKNNSTILELGIGSMGFYGDVKKKPTTYNTFDFNYHLGLERRYSSEIGLKASFLYGTVSREARDISAEPVFDLNYQSSLINADISLVNYFDKITKSEKRNITPFIAFGFGVMSYELSGDLKDADGKTYYLWSDGTLRSEDEYRSKAGEATVLQRDYEFESTLVDRTIAFYMPITIGVDLKLSDRVNVSFTSRFNHAFTDEIDNVSNGKKDWYNYTYFGFKYNLSIKKPPKETDAHFDGIDFKALDAQDNDVDQVTNFYDNCVETPNEIEVDKKGCPGDTDNDGIPNHRDKEPNSGSNTLVDLRGMEIKDWTRYTESGVINLVNRDLPQSKLIPKNDTQKMILSLPQFADGDSVEVYNLYNDAKIVIGSFDNTKDYEIKKVTNGSKLLITNYTTSKRYIVPVDYDIKPVKKGGFSVRQAPIPGHND